MEIASLKICGNLNWDASLLKKFVRIEVPLSWYAYSMKYYYVLNVHILFSNAHHISNLLLIFSETLLAKKNNDKSFTYFIVPRWAIIVLLWFYFIQVNTVNFGHKITNNMKTWKNHLKNPVVQHQKIRTNNFKFKYFSITDVHFLSEKIMEGKTIITNS